MNKIYKFFEENNIMYDFTGDTKSYHIGHARTNCLANILTVEISGNKYLLENPVSGTKTYYLTDLEGNTLCDGKTRTLGFSQQQFIDNVKEYFHI